MTDVDLRRLLAARLRIMAAESDLLLAYTRAISNGGAIHEYLAKMGESLRGRATRLEEEAAAAQPTSPGERIAAFARLLAEMPQECFVEGGKERLTNIFRAHVEKL